jgi:hypothetical protein
MNSKNYKYGILNTQLKKLELKQNDKLYSLIFQNGHTVNSS